MGLEIKRELPKGELTAIKKAALPILAAFGGVTATALIYSLFKKGTRTAVSWGIPMASDIDFALAIIILLGKRVPASLRIYLAALAVVDDLYKILLIACFYSVGLHMNYLPGRSCTAACVQPYGGETPCHLPVTRLGIVVSRSPFRHLRYFFRGVDCHDRAYYTGRRGIAQF